MDSAKKRNKLSMKKNMLVFGIGVFFTKIISFIFAPLYSRYLTTAEFGIIDVLTTTASLIIPILTLAITEGIIKYGLDDEKDLNKVFSTGAIITFIGCLLLVAFTLTTGQFIYSDYIVSTIAFFVFECIFLFFQSFAKAKSDTKTYVISSIVYSIFSTVMIILLIIVKDFGVDGYMYGMAIGTAIASVYLFVACKSWTYFSFRNIEKATVSKMIKYSAPLVISNIGYWIISGSDKYVTKYVLGDTYNGYLSVIHKIPTLCTFLYSVFNYAYTMSALRDHKLKESTKEEDNIFYSRLFKCVVLMLSIGSILVSILSQPIIMLYAPEYSFVWVFIPLYTFGIVFDSFRSFYTSIYCVKEKTSKIMLIVFFGALINLVSCFVLMKYTDLGLWATVVSTISGNLFIFLYYYFDSRKYVKINFDIKGIISIVLCLACASFPLYLSEMPYIYYPAIGVSLIVVVILNYKFMIQIFKDVFSHREKTI